MKSRFPHAAIGALLACALSGTAGAHEMFLRPTQAVVPPNSQQKVRLVTGTFDKSANSVSRDRMADVSILAHGAVDHPRAGNWVDDQRKTYSELAYGTSAPGTYVIGVSTRPSIIKLSPTDFIGYLKHDGIVDTLAEFEKRNDLATVRERYSKHVRTYIQVGDTRTEDYGRPLGYPVEILLESNPFTLRQGDKVAFKVLFAGKPLANQIVRAAYEGFHGDDSSGAHVDAHEMRTDANGRAEFIVTKRANWYVSLIHMQKIADPQADYESNWATATFQVQ